MNCSWMRESARLGEKNSPLTQHSNLRRDATVRNLMGKTIMAMQHVQGIEEQRETQFHANRMKDSQATKVKQARVEIEKHAELLALAVAKREEVMQNVLDSAWARIATQRLVKERALARWSRTEEESMEH